MGLNINDIVSAVQGASREDLRRLRDAFEDRGIRMGANEGDRGGSPTTATELLSGARSLKEAMEQALQPTQAINLQFDSLVQRTKGLTDATQDYLKQGFTGQMFDFSKAIDAANRASILFNGNARAGARINEAWAESTKVLAFTTADFQESLMKQSVVLERAGFNIRDFAAIVDSAALAFNNNEQEIDALTSTLINVQREIPVSGRELAQNFRRAQQDFAYSADQMMNNFIGLQKMSTTTGISFGALTSAFGEKLDTFQGSAQMAGQLNQILGKSAFNSMELLTMTEIERATRVRSAIMESGRSIEDMGKFEILALKKSLGFGSVEETRRFLRGELELTDEGAMARIEATDPNALKSRQLGNTMDFLVESINKTRSPLETMKLQMLKLAVDLEEKAVVSLSDFTRNLNEAGATIPTIIQATAAMATGQVERDPVTGAARIDRTELAGVVTKTNNMIVSLDKFARETLGKATIAETTLNALGAQIAKGIQQNIGTITFSQQALGTLADAMSNALVGKTFTLIDETGEVIIGPE
jgi:hypothetical protein